MYKSKVVKWELQYEAPPAISESGLSADNEIEAPCLEEDQHAEEIQSIIDEAVRHAEEIKQNAVIEAADILSDAETHVLAVRKNAEEAGYNAGYVKGEVDGIKKAMDDAAMMLSEINAIAEEMRRLKHEAAQDLERELICIALETAGKVMRQQCRVDTGAVSRMLEEVISETEGVIKLYLSEIQNTLEMQLDKSIVKKIKSFAQGLKTVIVSEPDSLLLETETGIVDLSIEVQMNAIREKLMSEYETQELN